MIINRRKRIRVKASYFLDKPEQDVLAIELVKGKLYRLENDDLCDGEGNRLYPTPVNGRAVVCQ